jgi:chitin disaccharide deacetylase
MSATHLVVNADDFGLTAGVNRGIIEAHERGIVTSASLMVRWSAAAEAARFARAHPELSVGLHLDFGEWAYGRGQWHEVYRVIDTHDPNAIVAEVKRQLKVFRELIGTEPSHIDSHQHMHRHEPARSIVLAAAREIGVPVRHFSEAIHYCGDFYGQSDDGQPYHEGIRVEALMKLLEELPPGWCELGCHPGLGDDLETMYRAERAIEVRTLCDPRIRTALRDLETDLCSFRSNALDHLCRTAFSSHLSGRNAEGHVVTAVSSDRTGWGNGIHYQAQTNRNHLA